MTYLPDGGHPGHGQHPPGQATAPYRPAVAAGSPPPHRSYTKLIVVSGIVLMVLVAVAVGLGGLLYTRRGALFGGKTVQAPSSVSSGRPIYHTLPGCDAMPTKHLAALVPGMQTTLKTRRDPGNTADGPYGVCQWDNLTSDNKPRNEDRSVEVTMEGYGDDNVRSGVESAKQNLVDARTSAGTQAAQSDSGHTYGAVRDLPDLGPGAFAQDYTIQSATWTYGGTDVFFQVDNLLVELSFVGSNGPDGREKPVPAAQTSAGAQTLAKDVTSWLSSCADCRG